jgi:hypothetical protein
MSEGEKKYTGFAAIYQLEQEKLKRERTQAPPEAGPPGEETRVSPESPAPVADARAESDSDAGARDTTEAPPASAAETPSLKAPAANVTRRPAGRKAGRGTRLRPAVVKAAAPPAEGSVEHYAQRWKQVYRLNKGEISVMRVMFTLTHEKGVSECYIKVPEVAEAAQLKKRRCQYVIRSLEELGFLDRLEEYDPSVRLGTKYRVNLKPVHLDLG